MRQIVIDMADCQTENDFYDLLLSALEAPNWHGRNLDALWDSITSDINDIIPPYSIQITGIKNLPESVLALITCVEALFSEARKTEKIAVEFNVG